MENETNIPWTDHHLSSVFNYISKLSYISSEFNLLNMYGEFLYFSREMVTPLMKKLPELLTVPKLHQVNILNEKEILAAFIDFLLQLLSHKRDFVHPSEDRFDHLKKELKFLVTILGDRSLLGDDEVESVKNLFIDFEIVANEAGSFVYSFIFSMDGAFRATRLNNALTVLLKDINHLRENISKLSFLLPFIGKNNMTPSTVSLSSPFIIDSFLRDLEDLMNRKSNAIVDVEVLIKVLHQQLMLSQSFLKDINVPKHLDIGELKGPVMQLRDLVYEADRIRKLMSMRKVKKNPGCSWVETQDQVHGPIAS